MLWNGRINVDMLVTDEFDLGGLEEVFDQMEARHGLKKIVYRTGNTAR